MIEVVKKQVSELLSGDQSGHGMDHIDRVLTLSLKFAQMEESANLEVVSLIALLHDVDDYKLFGEESAKNLTNAKRIMREAGVSKEVEQKVCEALHCIGYSKSLKGIRAESIEGKIVSDADMCDAIGIIGILRVSQYGTKINRPFFRKDVFPIDDESYGFHLVKSSSTVSFIFEVLLKYKDLMLTEPGKKEASIRHQAMIDFLYHYFDEVNAPEWIEYLDNYLKKSSMIQKSKEKLRG